MTISQNSEVLEQNQKTASHNSEALKLICEGCSGDDEEPFFRHPVESPIVAEHVPVADDGLNFGDMLDGVVSAEAVKIPTSFTSVGTKVGVSVANENEPHIPQSMQQ